MFDTPSQRFAAGLLAAAAVIAAILGAYHRGAISFDEASLGVSSFLAVATFGYVILTHSMASSMRDEMEFARKEVKLQQKPEVKRAIEEDLQPLSADVMNVKQEVTGVGSDGPDGKILNDVHYRAFHPVSTNFEDPASVPRFINTPVDVNPGEAYEFYQTVQEYQEAYEDAVDELMQVILSELSNPPTNSGELRGYAESAIRLTPAKVNESRWDSVTDDVLPLRQEIAESLREVNELRQRVRRQGGEVARELYEEQVAVMQEFGISEEELVA
jgi:cell fate (sporulation/competence/biofilm development) regulator YmcA (YheA/YmcA/DUF963 family)